MGALGAQQDPVRRLDPPSPRHTQCVSPPSLPLSLFLHSQHDTDQGLHDQSSGGSPPPRSPGSTSSRTGARCGSAASTGTRTRAPPRAGSPSSRTSSRSSCTSSRPCAFFFFFSSPPPPDFARSLCCSMLTPVGQEAAVREGDERGPARRAALRARPRVWGPLRDHLGASSSLARPRGEELNNDAYGGVPRSSSWSSTTRRQATAR